MKLAFSILSLLILLIVVFFGGARFNQQVSGDTINKTSNNRQILHYVDPMNPGHITQEPGIAPCGMPMEPVYADQDTSGSSGNNGQSVPMAPGTVSLNPQKQQTMGVQLGVATRQSTTTTLRALGRVIADENRVYPLIAASDGWMEEIREGTTGSLVQENQLLAQIKVYNYDFYLWQQRYLTELGYTSRISRSTSPLAEMNQSRRRALSGAGYQAGLPIPESEFRMTQRRALMPEMAAKNNPRSKAPLSDVPGAGQETPVPTHQHTGPNAPDASNAKQPDSDSTRTMDDQPVADSMAEQGEQSTHMDHEENGSLTSHPEGNLLFSSKGRQELLTLGVDESQLKALTETGDYFTHVDLRSPVKGYVLTRNVASLQRIERGAECFRIADLSRVWVEADVYDMEAQRIQPGMQAKVSLPRQNSFLTATVSEGLPRFDAVSRSLKVRLELDNPDYSLRPEMFVDVEILVDLPEATTVPPSAVIDSGKRKIVYVIAGENRFEPRPVTTGWQTSERVEIVDGLEPGEQVVVGGSFLIDSESRMKLATTRLMEGQTDSAPEKRPPAASTATKEPLIAPPAQQNAANTETKDLVCGMTVKTAIAEAAGLRTKVEGKSYFFCSEDCKKEFEENPSRFLGEKTDQPMKAMPLHHEGHQHD